MPTLILLHGAVGAADQLAYLKENVSQDFDVHVINFSGHGGLPYPDTGFSIETFAQDVLLYMKQHHIPKASFFGYSMGGYVAMYIALHYADKVEKIATLATKFHWDAPTAEKEMKMLNAEKIETKLPAFAQTLKQRHSPNDWKEVLSRTAAMLENMGRKNPLSLDDYTFIQTPCLTMIGDRDKMVSLAETVDVFKALPQAQMAVLPHTHHPIEQINNAALIFLLKQFLA